MVRYYHYDTPHTKTWSIDSPPNAQTSPQTQPHLSHKPSHQLSNPQKAAPKHALPQPNFSPD